MSNIRFGFTLLLITTVLGGMALGSTFDAQSVQEGNHLLDLARFYMREGHSHGAFICFFNLFVGLIINHLNLSENLKKIGSYAAMAAIFLPIALLSKGLAGAPNDFPPFGIIGVLGMFIALVILILGAFKTK